DGNWSIGAYPLSNSRYFHGEIDDVRIYRRALAAEEVQTLFSGSPAKASSQPALTSERVDAELPKPLHQWTFNDGTAGYSADAAHVTLNKSAAVKEGRLVLDGAASAYMLTAPIAVDIKQKTLVSWAQLDNLEQRGGSLLTLESGDGRIFDGIVYGERN